MSETINVYPLNDLAPHQLDENCPCQPRIEKVNGGTIIIHNSWDGRECHEYWDVIHKEQNERNQ